MQILLNHDEVMAVIDERLKSAVEEQVRSQIAIADDQEVSVNIACIQGVFHASVGISKIGTAPQTVISATPIVKTPVKRVPKAQLPPVNATSSFDTAPVQAPEEVLANGTGQLAGRGITDSPEDRQDPKAVTAEEVAPAALPVASKPVSIFAKPAPVEEAQPEDEPVREALGEAPAPEPVRKSIFSFPKSA